MTGPAAAAHLVLGDEELLVARCVAGVVCDIRAGDPDASVVMLEAGQINPGEFLSALAPSLFGERSVVVLQNMQDARKELVAAVMAYLGDAEAGAELVITHAGGAKGKAIADGLKDAGVRVLTAAKLTKHRDRIDFVRQEVRSLGGRCPEEAAEALLAAVGNDLREIAAACAQLVADNGGRVDAATVARYYRGRAEVSGFTVADAVMVGDVAGALESLRWALQVGVDPVPIADALADGVRTVSRVASAGRGSSFQLAGMLGLPPWKVERAQRQARGWSADALAEAMCIAAASNAAVKGGSDDRGYALERAILDVVGLRGSAGARST